MDVIPPALSTGTPSGAARGLGEIAPVASVERPEKSWHRSCFPTTLGTPDRVRLLARPPGQHLPTARPWRELDRPMDATRQRDGSNVLVLDPGFTDPVSAHARTCLRQLGAAIIDLGERVDEHFTEAVRLLQRVEGHVIVTGLGKSGLVGQKIAATLASTGTPSFFVHSAEASHGDLGMVTADDAVILISYSGETKAVTSLLPHLRQRGVPTVGIAGGLDSTLARGVDIALDVSVDAEACPNNLAPTSSSLATLALGDALAISLTRLRGFREEDFARLHPAGSLGRRLLRLGDVVLRQAVTVVSPGTPLRECIVSLAQAELPLALVHDGRRLLGTIGPVELESGLAAPERLAQPVEILMNDSPPVMSSDLLVGDAERRMERDRLDAVLVVDSSGEVRGVFKR